MFKIPIEKFKNDMQTKSAKEKKDEILNLFTNHNNLHSEKEFNDVQDILHKACQEGNLELIKIYLSETITDESNSFSFKIDKTNLTASLFKVNIKYSKQIIIPRTVKHESIEYLITSIVNFGKSISIIKFESNSAVRKIHKYAFYNSQIVKIHFPSSLKELEDGWCYDANNLKDITISPSNDRFIFKEDKYLLGKSDPKKDEFDVLLFARRNIKEISIPSNIKIITSFAFQNCSFLKKLEILPNSNLQLIKEYAFSNCIPLKNASFSNSNLQKIEKFVFENTQIEEIFLPTSLKELEDGWCYNVKKLTKITISPSNKNFIMKDGKYLLGKSDPNKDEFDILLFARRDIEKISIPSNIKIISPFAFNYCDKLTKIETPTNSNLESIESNAFSFSSIEEIFIPSKVLKIGEFAFEYCYSLQKVEIPSNSNLQTIGKYAFSNTAIGEIFIPSNVKVISSGTFKECRCLIKAEIPSNSKLQKIEEQAFALSYIKEISLPTSLKELEDEWCCITQNLTKFTISPSNKNFLMKENKYLLGKSDPNKDEFDTLLFARRDIEKISIPSNIKIISPYAFNYCLGLEKVEIPFNSNLESIGSNAFSHSDIRKIFIPSKISQLCDSTFENCENLEKVEIPDNSNLQTIGLCSFSLSYIKSFFITSKVSKINEYAFYNCDSLKIIGISEESKLESFQITSFFGCPRDIIIMIPTSLSKLIHSI